MSKIIIHNHASIEDDQAVRLVSKVISEGRVSNAGTAYCYATGFGGPLDEQSTVFVHAFKNKQSDTFRVVDA